LADLLGAYRDKKNVVVLGLARGGIPVAWEVAAALGAPLDAFIVRKLGAPGHEEFAMGALARDGRVVVNDDVLRALQVTPQQLRDVAEREGRELIRREAAYRDGRPPADVTGKTVILVDDGLATGASMFAAVQALREADPAQIVIAVPAAPESTCREFAGMVDDIVCATMPTPFLAVGESFWDFRQVSDEEVREFLATPTTGAAISGIRTAETAADVVDRAVSARRSSNWSRSSATHWITRAATACWPRTSCSTRSRTRRRSGTRRFITGPCSVGASRRGIFATSTWPRRCRRC
jgi:predicted phosphoribosyltransferase